MNLKTFVPKVAAVVAVGSFLMLGTHPVKAGIVSPVLVAKQSQALNAFRPLPLYWGGFSSAIGGNVTGLLWGGVVSAAAGGLAAASAGYFVAADDSVNDAQITSASICTDEGTFVGSGLTTLPANARALD
jgi:hypothetical protein